MPARIISVGFGTPTLAISAQINIRFVLTVEGTSIRCADATDAPRTWSYLWELLDVTDDSVIDSQVIAGSATRRDHTFIVADPVVCYVKLTVTTKHASGSITSPDIDLLDGGDGGGGEVEIPDTTAPDVPATPTVLVANGTTISGTITVHPDTDGDLAKIIVLLGSTGSETEADALQVLEIADDLATANPIVWSFSGTFPNATYKVKAKAVDAPVGNVSAFSANADAVVNVGSPPAAPGEPVIDSATAINSRRVDLAITPGSGTGNTNIYRAAGATCTPDQTTLLRGELDGLLAAYSDQVAAPATQYTYVVEKVNTAGQAFSDPATVTTPPAEAWPDNEPAGLTRPFTPYQGSGGKNWLGGYMSAASVGWTSGFLPDGTTPIVEEIADSTSKFGRCLIKRHTANSPSASDGHTGWLGALSGRSKFPAFPNGMQRMFIRFVFQLSANYQGHSGGTNKLFYFGSQRKPNEYFLGAEGSANASSFNIKFDADSNATGSARYYISTNKPIGRGVWHTLELDFIAETAGGSGDGIGRIYCDGTLVPAWNCVGGAPHYGFVNGSQLDGISFTGPGDSTAFNGTQFPLYWGGSNYSLKIVDDHIRVGEFYISGLAA